MANEQVVTPEAIDPEAAVRTAQADRASRVVGTAQAAIASGDINALNLAAFETGAEALTSSEVALVRAFVQSAIDTRQQLAAQPVAVAAAPVDGSPAVAVAAGTDAAAANASAKVVETPAGSEVKTEAAAAAVSNPLAAVKPAGATSPEAAALLTSLGIKQDKDSAMAIGGAKSTAA